MPVATPTMPAPRMMTSLMACPLHCTSCDDASIGTAGVSCICRRPDLRDDSPVPLFAPFAQNHSTGQAMTRRPGSCACLPARYSVHDHAQKWATPHVPVTRKAKPHPLLRTQNLILD